MIVVFAAALFFGAVASAHGQALSSACYDSQMADGAEQADVMRQMREMRPQANAPVQRFNQQQTQKSMSDYQARAQQMTAPYVARANGITASARGCANESCAAAVASQAQSFVNDVTANLLPQLYQLAAQARSDMLGAQQMSLDRVQEVFRRQTGAALPNSRGSIHYLPVCRQFRPLASIHQAPMAPFERHPFFRAPGVKSGGSASNLKDRIRQMNENQAKNLGEHVCVGTLAMGNVRCFKREEDPQGYGRICEKAASGSLIACYDAQAAWTPPRFVKREESISWFDRPSPALKLMAGGVPIEDARAKGGPMERAEKVAEQVNLVAPLLRPIEEDGATKSRPMTEPPVPFSIEGRIRGGKGFTQAELTAMSDSDRARLKQLIVDIAKESETSDAVRAGKELAKDVGAGLKSAYGTAAEWTAQNKDNIESTIQMMEAEALIVAPFSGAAVKGIEGVALTAQVGAKILAMSGEGKDTKEIAFGVAAILGAEGVKKLGEKGLAYTFIKNGFPPGQVEELSENTVRYGDALRKLMMQPKEGGD